MKLSEEQQKVVEELMMDAVNISAALCGKINDDIRSVAYEAACDAVLSFDPAKGPLTRWLYLTVRQSQIKFFRRERKHEHTVLEGDNIPVQVSDVDSVLIVEDMLSKLQPRERYYCVEHLVKGHSLSDIAYREGISPQRVQQIVERGRVILRERLCSVRENCSASARESTTRRKSLQARDRLTA